MSWNNLLADGRVRRHTTGLSELSELRALVERDLQDARLVGLSADRRFAIAYNAVLTLARMVLACAGYRTAGLGHHQTAFEALELAMGNEIAADGAYFDMCRRKRNTVEYDSRNAATKTEAQELQDRASAFRAVVERWIGVHHPALVAPPSNLPAD